MTSVSLWVIQPACLLGILVFSPDHLVLPFSSAHSSSTLHKCFLGLSLETFFVFCKRKSLRYFPLIFIPISSQSSLCILLLDKQGIAGERLYHLDGPHYRSRFSAFLQEE